MSNFQTILTAIFLAFFVFAVLIFSGMIKLNESSTKAGSLKGNIIVWGTLSSPELYKVFETATGENRDLYINYKRIDKTNYQQSLIEAFAADKGPDIFFITPDMVIKNQDFFYKIPFESYGEKIFRDSFIDGADVFLDNEGIIAFPVVVDPMVMYYNMNMLSDEGLAVPPKTWDELFNLSDKLTKKENDGTILSSMIALGRFDNVTNAKEILATLLIQSGDPIVKVEGDNYISVLDKNAYKSATSPFKTILQFLIEFSNPSTDSYSWNRALPNSSEFFTQGKLAFYLGKASELFKIQSTNPNLSFDVGQILQTKNATKRTFADIYAVAINKKSHNSTLAFSVAGLLSSPDTQKNFSNALSLPPASRMLLGDKPADSYMYTFYNASIISHSWADPNPIATNSIFNDLFNNILSNKLDIDGAITKVQGQLDQLIK